MTPTKKKPSVAENLAIPVGAALAALLLWSTPVVLPLKIFVVFLHELSHGLAALVTGGSIDSIEFNVDQGGLCVTRGGSRFLILSAGYLGSMAFGAILLVVAARSRRDRVVLGVVGAITAGVTLLYVRSGFGMAYGTIAGAVMILVAWRLPPWTSDLILKVVGAVSCLYAVWDIGSDVITRNIPGSDANALADLTGIPGIVWGILWVLVALVVSALALRAAAKGEAEPAGE